MTRLAVARLAGAVAACALQAAVALGQDANVVRDVRVTGAHELAPGVVVAAAQVRVGEPLPVPLDQLDDLAARIVSHYKEEGYSFAIVKPAFDQSGGVLSLTIDEGVIDSVEFTGVDDRLRQVFADEFALQAGDVFNRSRARQALDVVLRQTRGAVRPGRIFEHGGTFYDSRQLNARSFDQRGTFDLVDRNGERTLLVGLYEAAGRFKIVPDLGDREDWFTSVDGFVPSVGFGAAVFDHTSFNHAYVAGHLSYTTASHRAGYALGFERPFLPSHKVYVGAELHDLTTSDDQWQLSSLEASLAAVGPRRSFRDYYRRRGVQIDGAFRVHPRVELFGAWRAERHEALAVESDFSFWNSDEAFRANSGAQSGHLGSIVLGGSINSEEFDRESLDATYRRHQLDTLFGRTLDLSPRSREFIPRWRVDWTSEVSSPGALDSDFDFSRHILSARYRKSLTTHQEFGARAIQGWTGGSPPPQRLFAIGGIGSIHGYEFKAAGGPSMTLVNVEYALGWRNALQVFGFYDAGRVESSPWLKGLGWGVGLEGFRVDFGYRTNDIPGSLQVLLRFGRTF